MGDLRINPMRTLRGLTEPTRELPGATAEDGVPFGKIVKGVLEDAVKAEQESAVSIEQFAAGDMQDVHDVVMAVSKANMAVQLLVQVRNGVLEAYQELSRIQM
jgi:flagellar hook-basal body complex protein FliE